MKRERATELIEHLIRRVAAGGGFLDFVDEIWVFGSYARGALEPGDVDLNIEYTPDDDYSRYIIGCLAGGGDWLQPLRRAVKDGKRGLQLSFKHRDAYLAEGFDPILLWSRGEAAAVGLARVAELQPSLQASRAPRDAMVSEFEGLDRWIPLPVRKMLVTQIESGALMVRHIELSDVSPRSRVAATHVQARWNERSALRRAGLAALAYVETTGGDPRRVELEGRLVADGEPAERVVSYRWRRYADITGRLAQESGREWIEVLNPTRTQTLHAVCVTPQDRVLLADASFNR